MDKIFVRRDGQTSVEYPKEIVDDHHYQSLFFLTRHLFSFFICSGFFVVVLFFFVILALGVIIIFKIKTKTTGSLMGIDSNQTRDLASPVNFGF